MRRGPVAPLEPIFKPEITYGVVNNEPPIGATTQFTRARPSTVTLPISIPTPTVTAISYVDHTVALSGGGSYSGGSASMNVEAGDLLLGCQIYRGSGFQAAPVMAVGGAGVQLSGLATIFGNQNFDTLGTSDGSARLDRAAAASTGAISNANGGGDNGGLHVSFRGAANSAPAQSAVSTADATDNCDISLPSAPTRKVVVFVAFGPAGNGENLNPAAPSGWTKRADHSFNSKAVMCFEADSPQQTFTYSLTAGTTVNGGRSVFIIELT